MMVLQIALGSAILLLTILMAATSAFMMEWMLFKFRPWLVREPHYPKLVLILSGVLVWVLGIITASVWIWAILFYALGAFPTLEEAVYFTLVSFTTLGYGDVILPKAWRIMSGMVATNGFLNFGLLIALMVEALRHVRVGQHESKRRQP